MSTVRCKKCNSLVASDKKKCHICGAKIGGTSTPVKILAVVIACVLLITCYAGKNDTAPTIPSPAPAQSEAAKPTPAQAAPEKRDASAKSASNTDQAYGSLPDSKSAPIREDALQSYTKTTNPKLYKAWGDKGFREIEKAQRQAANLVASSGKCDAVEIVGLAMDRSRAPDHIVNFVQCENGSKFFMGANDLKSVPRTEFELARSEDSALADCKGMVLANSPSPSRILFSNSGITPTTNKTNGNTSIFMRYKFKTDGGAEIPLSAYCVFPNGRPPTITIKEI